MNCHGGTPEARARQSWYYDTNRPQILAYSALLSLGLALPDLVGLGLAEGGGELVSLFRAVGPEEMAIIELTGRIPPSLSGLEVKYFALTAEDAASYARQAVVGFGDAPYWLAETQIARSALAGNVVFQVDRSVSTLVLSNSHLPMLAPARIRPYMPIGR